MALDAKEKQLVQAAFYGGPSVLLDEGYSPDALKAFLEREDVAAELSLLKRELDLHDGLKARAKFALRRSLNRMVDPAAAILLQSLAGPDYVRDEKTGNVLRDSRGYPLLRNPEPTRGQQWAVSEIIRGTGLHDFRITADPGVDNNVELLFRKAERPKTIDVSPLGETEEERVVSRERVRTAIERLIPRLPEARARVRDEFDDAMGVPKSRRASRKKKTTKKATRKKVAKKKTTKKKTTRRGKATG